jgi:nucleotide-binding universal stress UspA family protein
MERIVVGVDGSEQAAAALRWAAEEAALHGIRPTALLAWDFLDRHWPGDVPHPFAPTYGPKEALDALGAAVTSALGEGADVHREIVRDAPISALLAASEEADLVVLGARGHGGFPPLRLGSVSERVVERATGPVAVVREVAPVRGSRVVVGIDGSRGSTAALQWAASEAARRDAPLTVVHAWQVVAAAAPWGSAASWDDEVRRAATIVLAAAVADPALDGLKVEEHLCVGNAAGAILEQAVTAGLVVVGSHGKGAVAGLLLGSVSRQVVQHATCPVVVV